MKTLKTHSFWLRTCFILSLGVVSAAILIGAECARAQTNPAAPMRPVTSASSNMERGATTYSIKFPGGTAGEFFEFLRTNGFASDNVLFAGRAASIRIPSFAVSHVRLRDVAKSLELVSEGKLNVEIVEQGEHSDENIWRIRASEGTSPIKTKTCAMANFFHTPNAVERVPVIVDSVEKAVLAGLANSGRADEGGSTHTLAAEKIVVVVGPEAYVEAVSSALEAAEKVATADVLRQK